MSDGSAKVFGSDENGQLGLGRPNTADSLSTPPNSSPPRQFFMVLESLFVELHSVILPCLITF